MLTQAAQTVIGLGLIGSAFSKHLLAEVLGGHRDQRTAKEFHLPLLATLRESTCSAD
jgi:hypothetical protein